MITKKIIALDVGDAWIGVAHTDPDLKIVFPYQTWKAYEFDKKFAAYLKAFQVSTVVIGLPLTLSGNRSQQTEKVQQWVEQKKKDFPHITFIFEDERLSSQFASHISLQNMHKSVHSNHAVAAAIILEHFVKKNLFNK